MQTMAIGFMPKTLDLGLVIWTIRRSLEDKVFITPKQSAFNPFIWQHFTSVQARRRGFVIENGLIKIKV